MHTELEAKKDHGLETNKTNSALLCLHILILISG